MALFRPVCIAAALMFAGTFLQAAAQAQTETQPATVAVDAPYQPSAPLNTMPRWAEFPGAPEGVPTPAEIRLRVNAQLARRQQLNDAVSNLVWDRQEPDAIAAEAKGHIDPAYLNPVDGVLTPQQVDAFAASLRAKASPPPVAQ